MKIKKITQGGTSKKAVSPVVATILLIAMVIIIAVIIFLWFRTFVSEAVEKDVGFGKQNIENVCKDVQLRATLYTDSISVSNYGNVPVEQIRVKLVYSNGNYDEEDMEDSRMRGGGSRLISASEVEVNDFEGYKEITIIPILKGITESGEKETFVCDEMYGTEAN